MKNRFRIFAAFLTFALLMSIHTASMAAPSDGLPPLPPADKAPGPPGHGGGGNQGAPIGNGTYILLILASGYALRKVYVMRKIETAEE